MRQYDLFDYRLPKHGADYYAGRAVTILKEIRERFPKQFEKNFRAPSEVLTISGVRAFDTYYDFGKDETDADIQGIRELLKRFGIWVVDESAPFMGEDNPERSYSLLNLEALKNIPNQYSFVPGWKPFLPEKADRDQDFILWWNVWKNSAAGELGEDQDKWSFVQDGHVDWWIPHNLTFGMLLGYPGEAISSCLWSEVLGERYELIQSNIELSDKFDGAQPVYDFSPEIKDNPNVVKHQQLWSDILEQTYAQLGLLGQPQDNLK